MITDGLTAKTEILDTEDTLKSNIAFGVKGQDINAVIKAAEAACIFQEAVRILFSKKRVIAVTRNTLRN